MAVYLIHPSFDAILTGGALFNAQILKQAAVHDFSIISVRSNPGDEEGPSCCLSKARRGDLVIWDSLYISDLAARNNNTAHYAQALLLHYLPSENPLLSSDVRKRMREEETIAIQIVDVLMVPGHKQKHRIERRYPGKPVYLIEPGVGPEFINKKPYHVPPSDRGTAQLLTVANLIPAKGHMDLAFPLAGIADQEWRWHIVGSQTMDTSYAIKFRRTIHRLGLVNKISFHSTMKPERLVRFMNRMDIYISASRYESYGMALAEAVTHGLPIVTTTVGDAARMVFHGKNGFLIANQNPNEFRRCLAKLMRNPSLCRKFRKYREYHAPTWRETFKTFRSTCFKFSAP